MPVPAPGSTSATRAIAAAENRALMNVTWFGVSPSW
jgi:hypothetical protein